MSTTRPVRRGTKEFNKALDSAVEINCYSLGTGFIAEQMRDDDSRLIIPPRQWLRHELERFDFAKLRQKVGTDQYVLHVHGNLWYEFRADAN